MSAIPGTLAGRYKLETLIGEGAFASTYRATDTRLLRTVAVKLLRARHSGDEAFAVRFEREARAAAQVSHPNVVQVHDFGRDGTHAYIVMHYVAGPTLGAYVRQRKTVSLDEVVSIISQVLEGLQAIHDQQIIHRDIKPQNILLEPNLTPKLGDFGVAHIAPEASLTQTGTTIGTAAYMAPEQATGGTIGPRADLYSVGVVLYELTTGQLPFSGSNPVQVMYKHVNDVPAPPGELNPGLPSGLEAVILRALAKRPEDRFASAEEMRQALLAARSGVGGVFVAAPFGDVDHPTAESQTPAPPYSPPPVRPRRSGGEPSRWPFSLLFLAVVLAIAVVLVSLLGYGPDFAFSGSDANDETPTVPVALVTETPEPDPEPTATDVPVVVEPTPTDPPDPTPTVPPEPEPEPEPEPTEVPATEPPIEPEPEPEPTEPPPPDPVQTFLDEVARNTPINPARIPEGILNGPAQPYGRDAFVEGGAYQRPDGVLYDQPAAHLYSQATDYPSTTVQLDLAQTPEQYAVVRIVGMDDESDAAVPIRISVNGYVIHEGPAPFGSEVWTDTAWVLGDPGALQAGTNSITIEVIAPEGEFGRPPWLLLTAMRVYIG